MADRLFNKNFFLLWQGQLVSQIGSQAFSIAMLFWLKEQTGSATMVGAIMMASALPAVLLSPFGGAFADHYSRKKIIVISDFLSGVLVLLFVYTIMVYPNSHYAIPILFAVAIMIGVIKSFFTPAIMASIPDLVPKSKIDSANALDQTSVQISQLLGQGLGGIAFVLLGAPLLFLINGISYLFSAVSESFITIPQNIASEANSLKEKARQFKKDIMEGVKIVFQNRGIRTLFFAAGIINFFAIPFFVLLPFFVEDFLHQQADWYGYILAGFGLGSLIGYGIAGGLQIKKALKSRLALLSLCIMAFMMFLIGWVTLVWWALFLMILIGITNGYFNVIVLSTLQTKIESEYRGRVFGLLTTLTGGLVPISMGLSGFAADLLDQNIPGIFIFCGFITFLLTVPLMFNSDLKSFLDSEE